MLALVPMRHRMVMLAFAAAVLGTLLIPAPSALAQSANTFGTDQRYCDNSALSKILSTSKGNLIGSAAGGAVGGLLGNQFGKSSGKTVATIVGVLGGALAGGYVGRSMDQTDQGCVGETLEHAPANQPVAWQNPSTGSSYWVTPTRDLRGRKGEPCRNYVTDAVVNGAVQRSENTACRQPDGRWVPVSQDYVETPSAQPAPASEAPGSLSPDAIIKVQQRLRELGFYVRDNIDGKWGPHTAEAVSNFQRSKGLKPTGQLDLDTISALDLPTDATRQQ